MRMLLQLIRKSLDNYFLNDTFNLHHPWTILLGLVWAWLFGTSVRSPWMKQQHCVWAWEVFWGGMKGAPGLLQNMPLPQTYNCCSHSVQQHAQWATCSPNRMQVLLPFLSQERSLSCSQGLMPCIGGRACCGGSVECGLVERIMPLRIFKWSFFFFHLHKTLKWRW